MRPTEPPEGPQDPHKASTGAHPVRGAIGDEWGKLNWEAGPLGYPVDDELTDPDGVGKGQRFEGGVMAGVRKPCRRRVT
ncbi:LGFP repeat-containing protein [Streptomyces sp. NPDC018057]|uniref:LGFP repeat-containing protein n=1 Tax=unclassified Streptomyces TaxID=2593676 RepID=UPI0037B5B0A8